ncbi:MAG: hypothetical protein U1E45_05325 [Geminicoccaceae bacterium]
MLDSAAPSPSTAPADAPIVVDQFREILIWPVQLMPLTPGAQIHNHWERLEGPDNPWQEVVDEFTEDCADFSERHYIEFTSFTPQVQRFLYGEGTTDASRPGYGASPIKVFRRYDVTSVRVTLQAGSAPIELKIAHVDLYFFYDIDIAILVVEVGGHGLPLAEVQDLLFRFGRTYPTAWNEDGSAAQCCHRIEWLGPDGQVVCSSDNERKAKFLAFVCRHRAPYISAHWAFLLQPLALHHSEETGQIRYRQLEYQRMPLLAWLSVPEPERLERGDWVRLGLAAPPGRSGSLPFSRRHLASFESRYCYDRYWDEGGDLAGLASRMLCSGAVFVMVGGAEDRAFTDLEIGLLGQFRHQYFLLGLIAHLHRAALLMLSDRLVDSVSRLDINDVESVKGFKRDIRQLQEIFLRFTHRYWFHDVSIHRASSDLFRMWTSHLDTDRLYNEVREEVHDMSHYLDSDGLRRQANSVLRLTVVTIFGLAGTLATGLLGMNLLDATEAPMLDRLILFLLAFVPALALIVYTVIKAKRLADFLEALSDERLSATKKLDQLRRVWTRG